MALRTATILRNRGVVEIRTRGSECVKNAALGSAGPAHCASARRDTLRGRRLEKTLSAAECCRRDFSVDLVYRSGGYRQVVVGTGPGAEGLPGRVVSPRAE